MEKIIKIIETINKKTGLYFGWTILIITLFMIYDIISRYIVRSSAWAADFNMYAFGIYHLLGGGYVLLRKAHIRTDIFYAKFSHRKQAFLDCVFFIFFLVFILALFWSGWDAFWTAFIKNRMLAGARPWPLWPYLLAIPIGAFLILLQGIADFIKNIKIVTCHPW